jgi:Xaa-Pro aminopeptidase
MKMRKIIRGGLAGVCFLFLVAALGHARVRQPNTEYQARRAKLRAIVDSPVVLFGYTGHEDSSALAQFYQQENFYYLTGHNEAGAALVLIPQPPAGKTYDGPSEILYLPPRNPFQERWEGPKLGPADEGIGGKTGFAAVEPFANLSADLQRLVKIFPNVYTELPHPNEDGYPSAQHWTDWIKQAAPEASLHEISPALGTLRQIKSAGEVALLQKAVDLSVDAHLDAMKHMRPGLYEYQIAARMEYVHKEGGCDREAYAPIVGTGFHSTVLHFDALDSEIHDGDVVVLDVACEYGGYAADITRTLPANGKFTPRQREIYDIVLGAQNAALAALKPGMTFARGGAKSVSDIAYNYINTHGKDKEGRSLGRYFIHGLGHHLGLDVHDTGNPVRAFEPGMTVTMEPGIYIPEENLGVRIEDDVLIMDAGYKLLTERLPREPDEIEKIMAEAAKHPLSLP